MYQYNLKYKYTIKGKELSFAVSNYQEMYDTILTCFDIIKKARRGGYFDSLKIIAEEYEVLPYSHIKYFIRLADFDTKTNQFVNFRDRYGNDAGKTDREQMEDKIVEFIQKNKEATPKELKTIVFPDYDLNGYKVIIKVLKKKNKIKAKGSIANRAYVLA